jgi:hypothetical protein
MTPTQLQGDRISGFSIWDLLYPIVMPGLGPGIYVLLRAGSQDVDGRDKPGHDDTLDIRHMR